MHTLPPAYKIPKAEFVQDANVQTIGRANEAQRGSIINPHSPFILFLGSGLEIPLLISLFLLHLLLHIFTINRNFQEFSKYKHNGIILPIIIFQHGFFLPANKIFIGTF